MKVISDSAGFALWFTDERDLDSTIESLLALKKYRAENPLKSWPAFHGVLVDRPGGEEYFRMLMRWLRSRLHKSDPSKFKD